MPSTSTAMGFSIPPEYRSAPIFRSKRSLNTSHYDCNHVLLVAMRFTPIAPLLWGGCFYAPGSSASLGAPFVGVREPIGCLDLAVARGSDAVATAGPVVAYA